MSSFLSILSSQTIDAAISLPSLPSLHNTGLTLQISLNILCYSPFWLSMSSISLTLCLKNVNLLVHSMLIIHERTIILFLIDTYYLISDSFLLLLSSFFSFLYSDILLPYCVKIFHMSLTMFNCGLYCSISS